MTDTTTAPPQEAPAPPEVPTTGLVLPDYFTETQLHQLLAGINPVRVSQRDNQSHLEAYDVRAHLNRLFGFARWDGEVLEYHQLFEEIDGAKEWNEHKPGRNGSTYAGWDDKRRVSAGYSVHYRLVVRAPDGTELARYSEVATGDATNFPGAKRADAHDFAVKTAESQALKRCAINLGDQFGLSLYASGSTRPIVMRTLVGMPLAPAQTGRVDEGAQEVVPEAAPAGVDPVTGEAAPDLPREPHPAGQQAPHPPAAQQTRPAEQPAPVPNSVTPTKTPDEICRIIVHAATVEELDIIDRRLIETGQDGVEVGDYTLAQYVQGKRDSLRDAAKAAKAQGPGSPTEAAAAALAGGKTPPTGRPEEATAPPVGKMTEPDPADMCRATAPRRGIVAALVATGVTEDQLAERFGFPLEQVATKRLRDLIPIMAAEAKAAAERTPEPVA